MTVNFDDFKKEAKIRELKEKVKAGYDKAKQVVTEHPAESLALATTLVGSVSRPQGRSEEDRGTQRAVYLRPFHRRLLEDQTQAELF